jgi:hypothetical protein
MHYRNGRPANNGDKVVLLEGGEVKAVGVIRDAVAGNDYCNGYVQVGREPNAGGVTDPIACMCDCLHVEDVATILGGAGMDKRPAGM